MDRGAWGVVIASVFALGCSGTVGSTAAGDGGARVDVIAMRDAAPMGDGAVVTPDAGAERLSAEGALAAVRRALCEQGARCDWGESDPLRGAPSEVVERCARGEARDLFEEDREMQPRWSRAVREGRARVDVDRLARCIAMARDTCGDLGRQDALCDAARLFVGALAVGAPCATDAECSEGLWCDVSDPSPSASRELGCRGRCSPRVALGGACRTTRECATLPRGTPSCTGGACAAVIQRGEPQVEGGVCSGVELLDGVEVHHPCATGLFCRDEGGVRRCRGPYRRGVGEPCDFGEYQCAEGLFCDRSTDPRAHPSYCHVGEDPEPPPRAPPSLGERCTGECVRYARCVSSPVDPDGERRCRVALTVGEGASCVDDERYTRVCAAPLRCVGGVCSTVRAEIGDPCDSPPAVCPVGAYCSTREGCASLRADGAECLVGYQCASGACLKMRCAPAFCPR